MAKFITEGYFSEREAQCPHHVVFENRHHIRPQVFDEVAKWLGSDAATGLYVSSSVNFRYRYCFSDAATAMHFKLLFG
jgi:hypothetical protein